MGVAVGVDLSDFPVNLFRAVCFPSLQKFSLEFVPSYSLPYCPWIGYQEKEPVLMIAQSAKLKDPACTLECSQIHLLDAEGAYLVELRYKDAKDGHSLLSVLAQDKRPEIYVEYPARDRQCIRVVDSSFPQIPGLSPSQEQLYDISKEILEGRTDKYAKVLRFL